MVRTASAEDYWLVTAADYHWWSCSGLFAQAAYGHHLQTYMRLVLS